MRSKPRKTNWSLPKVKTKVLSFFVVLFGVLGLGYVSLQGTPMGAQVDRFFSFQDPAVRLAVVACLLLGLNCGLLGAFMVVRRLALVGDTLSHCVLPGVILGFLWGMYKNPWTMFFGAALAGLLGLLCVSWIKRTTTVREDSVLGIILTSFYAVGICLITMIQRLNIEGKAGVDKFLFGQASALSEQDVLLLAIVAILAITFVVLFYKELLVSSFDPDFSRTSGIPVSFLFGALMFLLTFSVVTALQATGAVLVVAMLITPAAAAYLLTDRMHHLLIFASGLGMLSGLLGAFFSFLGSRLPTGPFMVVGAGAIFLLAFLFGPQYGVFPRIWRRYRYRSRIQGENTLKAIYRMLEDTKFEKRKVALEALARFRKQSFAEAVQDVKVLKRKGWAHFEDRSLKVMKLSPEGWHRACQITRNHRLWELYLTFEANYAPDHVHDDAERIEHLLGEEIVKQLEERLNFPNKDPHGKLIPSAKDIEEGLKIYGDDR